LIEENGEQVFNDSESVVNYRNRVKGPFVAAARIALIASLASSAAGCDRVQALPLTPLPIKPSETALLETPFPSIDKRKKSPTHTLTSIPTIENTPTPTTTMPPTESPINGILANALKENQENKNKVLCPASPTNELYGADYNTYLTVPVLSKEGAFGNGRLVILVRKF
jgi:hypothetical protein